MHPILFRVPLPHGLFRLWWALAVASLLAGAAATASAVRRERADAVAAAMVSLAFALAGLYWEGVSYPMASLPIYTAGATLGASLVVGWYVSLPLAERDGMPGETMANCYVVTVLCALVGSRLLYVVTNPDEFASISDVLALRSGGMVAYGGFIGGLLGSWAFLVPKRIRVLAWADDAVPSVAAGVVLTRIGCYLYGCDFGRRLPDGAPQWLKTLGTFPHWPDGLVPGDGSPPFVRHLEQFRGKPLEAELLRTNMSFPVHPTQLYEALAGAVLLGLVLWQRRHLRFRAQVFFLFVFAYGYARFLLDLWRDDSTREVVGPMVDAHVLIPACLLAFAAAFAYGISLAIPRAEVRMVANVLAFVPAAIAYWVLRPVKSSPAEPYQLSVSQALAFLSALAVAYFYARFWSDARGNPAPAMSVRTVGSGPPPPMDEGDRTSEDRMRAPAGGPGAPEVAR